ncbi:MAG TPA: peptide MFS transporter [Puia sp.]|jgi:POT family proton-dependent oligopeptide transporter|nr:peptide MFS transporter [Puia sp.]
MSEQLVKNNHPKGLYILFATEMWERFNFYGMRAILILFMTKALLFDHAFASNLYGSYLSLVYLSPLLGGYIADRYWGNRRSIIVGGIVMAIGEVVLFLCGTFYHSIPQLSAFLFFAGLGLMITGNGFFKPNISSLVGQLYPKTDHRKDAAYTIFYMGINVGGALGPFVCGLVGDTGNPADFRWAFLAGGVGMCISVIVQKLFQHKYVVDPDNKVLGLVPNNSPKVFSSPVFIVSGLVALAAIMIGLFYLDSKFNYLFYLLTACIIIIPTIIFVDKSLTAGDKKKVAVIFVVCFFVIFFWGAFEQAGASLTFFADEQTQRHVGLKIPIWPIIIISAALLFYVITLFKKAAKNLASAFDKNLRIAVYGLLFILSAGVIMGNVYLLSSGSRDIDLTDIPASWFQSLNSTFVVLFAPFFAWFWLALGKKEPSSPTKMALGLLLLALGYLWIAHGVDNVGPGVKVSMIWITGMYALHTSGELCLSPIGLSLVNKLSPTKFLSLLMAIWFTANAFGNKVAGVLSSLYPPGVAEIKRAKDIGIDLGNILYNKVTPGAGQIVQLKNHQIPYEFKTFLGYHINNLYDFFMLFVCMAGVASLILFVVTKKLQKMMQAV